VVEVVVGDDVVGTSVVEVVVVDVGEVIDPGESIGTINLPGAIEPGGGEGKFSTG
jgi:hypothetical protein